MEPFKQLVIENLKPSTTYEVTAEALGYQKCDKSLEMKSEKVKENFKTLGSGMLTADCKDFLLI